MSVSSADPVPTTSIAAESVKHQSNTSQDVSAPSVVATEPVGAGASAAIRADPNSSEPTPVFRPPLFEQRQGFILSTLRKHRAREVLEVGCERGRLLTFLAQPEFQVDTFPFHRFPQRLERRLPPHHWTRDVTGLVLERLEGLDLDGENLKAAVHKLELVREREIESAAAQPFEEGDACAPAPNRSHFAPLRFVPMRAAILQGGLEIYNERFRGIDAIVASEVIEHLHEPVLDAFAPILLGRYRPRLLVLTTPNYAFNVHFPRTDTQPGVDDPTGRTERKFRHPDHKFEWTTEEFREWCERAAERFGYEVEIGGLGPLNIERRRRPPKLTSDVDEDDDEAGQEGGAEDAAAAAAAKEAALIESLMSRADETNRFASQTAVFKRLGKGPAGTAASSGESRSRSRSNARAIGLLSGSGTGMASGAAAAAAAASGGVAGVLSSGGAGLGIDTDGVSESDDSRLPQRGRDRSVDPALAVHAGRRPSVISGSESEVGPLQSFTVGPFSLAGGAAGAGLGLDSLGRTASSSSGGSAAPTSSIARPSIQHTRRVSRSRKPEPLPWLSGTGPETSVGAPSVDLSNGGSNAIASISPLANQTSLLTSTGGLDGITITPTPAINLVQHKLLWEADFPAVAPSRPVSPSPDPADTDVDATKTTTTRTTAQQQGASSSSPGSRKRLQPVIAQAVMEVLEMEADLVRVPAVRVVHEASPNLSAENPKENQKEAELTVPTIVEARLPLWSALRDDRVRRNAEGSVSRLLAGLNLLPRSSDPAAVSSADRARSSSQSRSRSSQRGRGGSTVASASIARQLGSGENASNGEAKPIDATPSEESPSVGSAPVASATTSLRPVRDASSVMATDGATWELRLISRPLPRARDSDDEDDEGEIPVVGQGEKKKQKNGAAATRRPAPVGVVAREDLVDGEDDGNEEDDEDDDESDDEDDLLFDGDAAPAAKDRVAGDAIVADDHAIQKLPKRARAAPRSSARANYDLYLVYFGPEATKWLELVEADAAELRAEEDARARQAQEKRAEIDARGNAIEQLGGWGNPALAGLSLDEADRRISEVRQQGAAGNGSGAADASPEATSTATATAPDSSQTGAAGLTGWE
ncbi:hypothetical protein OC861_000278 [Tilletia horrida]|nr:hypothetical protein OC861_000278 [Tilletia horrida]